MGRLRRGDARPRRGRLHRSGRRPRRARAPGRRAARPGMHLAYVTNNASRTTGTPSPSTCASSGSTVDDGDVVTSAQAAARLLAEQLPDGVRGVRHRRRGASRSRSPRRASAPVQDAGGEAGRRGLRASTGDLRWSTVIAGAILVRDGLPWVASNTDLTVPTPRGSRARQRRPGRAWSPGSRTASRWWPASRSRRCSRRRCAASAGSGRWWSGTGSTPTSRAPNSDRLRQPAGDDRGDRPRPAGRRGARTCARRTSQPTWAGWDAARRADHRRRHGQRGRLERDRRGRDA